LDPVLRHCEGAMSLSHRLDPQTENSSETRILGLRLQRVKGRHI
jgi:hypothetical protein